MPPACVTLTEPFALWMVVIALAIFKDHNVPTLYPRWVAYLNVWCAILIFPAGYGDSEHSPGRAPCQSPAWPASLD